MATYLPPGIFKFMTNIYSENQKENFANFSEKKNLIGKYINNQQQNKIQPLKY